MKRRLLLSTFGCLVFLNLLLGFRFYTAHAAGGEEDSGYADFCFRKAFSCSGRITWTATRQITTI
jgi:hypothetical protein